VTAFFLGLNEKVYEINRSCGRHDLTKMGTDIL
jgi:hypothetical protein